jgi:hypothetical protein
MVVPMGFFGFLFDFQMPILDGVRFRGIVVIGLPQRPLFGEDFADSEGDSSSSRNSVVRQTRGRVRLPAVEVAFRTFGPDRLEARAPPAALPYLARAASSIGWCQSR